MRGTVPSTVPLEKVRLFSGDLHLPAANTLDCARVLMMFSGFSRGRGSFSPLVAVTSLLQDQEPGTWVLCRRLVFAFECYDGFV